HLTREVLQAMFLTRVKTMAVVLLLAGIVAAVVGVLHHQARAGRSAEQTARADGAAPAGDDPARADREALQGGWECQSGEREGKPLPEEEARKIRVAIKDDRMMLIPGGEWSPLTLKLDPAKNPRVLTVTASDGPDKGKSFPMIYEVDRDADTLKLCWDTKQGKAIPAAFATKAGDGLMLLVLKHEVRPPADMPEKESDK